MFILGAETVVVAAEWVVAADPVVAECVVGTEAVVPCVVVVSSAGYTKIEDTNVIPYLCLDKNI